MKKNSTSENITAQSVTLSSEGAMGTIAYLRELLTLRLPEELESLTTTAARSDDGGDVSQEAQALLYEVRATLLECCTELTQLEYGVRGLARGARV